MRTAVFIFKQEKFDLFVRRRRLEATAVGGGGLQTFYRDATTAAVIALIGAMVKKNELSSALLQGLF